MARRMKIVAAARAATALKALSSLLSGARETDVVGHLIGAGERSPLSGLATLPDLLVLHLEPEHLSDLAAMAEVPAAQRPILIVTGPTDNAEAMRLAMRVGARDFLPEPVRPADLLAAIDRIRNELPLERHARSGETTVFIGAAGGVGTSFVASTIGHLAVTESEQSAVLVDLDVQFAPLAHYLGLSAERGLIEALDAVDGLDEHALPGFMAQHRSGLHVIGTVSHSLVTASSISPQRLARLLGVLADSYQHVFIDSPHHLDALNTTAIGMARHVVLVMQQSVAQVRNAATLLQVLTRDLAVARSSIKLLVNRYDKRAAVSLDDIRSTLSLDSVFVVPSQYQPALGSIDSGVPLAEFDRNSSVGRALMDVLVELGGARKESSGLFRRLALFGRKD